MKYFIWVCLLNCLLLQVDGQKKEFMPGAVWTDEGGERIYAHGGGILHYDGRYYWYGENRHAGVNCYSSENLYDWKREGTVLAWEENRPGYDLEKGCIIERPKVIYNAKTGKFVMWFHLELKGQGYGAARTAVAVADKPEGPFRYLRSMRCCAGKWPENMTEEQRNNTLEPEDSGKWWSKEWMQAVKDGLFVRRDFEGGQMSRDMTLFVDEDGKAYHIYSSEENLTLQIAELTEDYQGHTGRYVRVFPGGHNEAPAIFKRDGKYWMITSGCTGWAPNAARLAVADHMLGPWKALGNPCKGAEANLTFRSQSTYVLQVDGKEEAYIFMADRWNPKDLPDSRYIWLPLKFEGGKPVLYWTEKWSLEEK